ncbi:MAG: Gfo/Idh/MocA family oxidoreductase [Clostridia bacterium]|nr:Gfo/Idh/MocA family oxidoreductase [Clostridia bacterium]
MKVGLIGIGGMGNVHFNCYKKMEGVEIAVADIRVDMAKEKIKDDSIPVYASYEEMIEREELDFVDICTPSYMHADMAVYALEHGLHVLCEKPMSINSSEAQRMIDASEENSKLLMIAHVVRFMSPYVYLKSVIDSCELGKPVHVIMHRLSEAPKWSWENWMLVPEHSGGVALDLSIHDIDYTQYVFGKPESIQATYHDLKDNSNHVSTTFSYDGFSVETVGGWFNASIPFRAEYLAVFERGYVESKGGKITKNGKEVTVTAGETSEDTGINLSGADGYADEIAYFIDCIKSGRQPMRVTPESSKYSVELVEEILKTAKKV